MNVKKEFYKLSQEAGFKPVTKDHWFQVPVAGDECVVSFLLYRLNTAKRLRLTVSVLIEGAFGIKYEPGVEKIERYFIPMYHETLKEFGCSLDLDNDLTDDENLALLKHGFEALRGIVSTARTRSGLRKIHESRGVFFPDSVWEEIQKLEGSDVKVQPIPAS